ncbi:MAG: FCD domain-containing protein [Lentisphaeria bacterium]|nr:MAG: FCD domain-containing protein [Lentisphaeria bacterium]
MEQSTRRESLTDIAEKKIFDYLRENHFRPGDRLPMESELAEKFQISRTVVREALSRLRMMGFIESKKRRGMVVAHPNIFETIAKVIDPAFLDEEEKQDFFQLRLTIELGLADLLAEHLTEKDLADLEEIVREEERDPADYRRFLACDCRFHARVYEATRCRSLASFQKILLGFFSDFETRFRHASSNFARRFDDPKQVTHRDLLDAFITRDAETIQRVMRRHLTIHRNPQLEEKKRNNSPEVKGNHHESGKLL